MKMNKNEIKKIVEKWLIKKNKKKEANKNLFKEGIIDSFEVIDFISYLEDEFKIKFNSNEFQDPKFMILNNIVNLIFKKLND